MANTLWFDMDGTIYPLYKMTTWLYRLENKDATVFNEISVHKSAQRIRQAITALQKMGWQVGVITWAPKDVDRSDPFFAEVEREKRHWLHYYFPEIHHSNFYCLTYGTDKTEIVKINVKQFEEGTHILVDDNKMVRKDWRAAGKNFLTINANRSFCKELEGLVM